jgi:hypothetical protein
MWDIVNMVIEIRISQNCEAPTIGANTDFKKGHPVP